MTTAHDHQASAFLAWHAKRGGPIDSDYWIWARSKRLSGADFVAIRRIVDAELVARGEAVVTDVDPDMEVA